MNTSHSAPANSQPAIAWLISDSEIIAKLQDTLTERPYTVLSSVNELQTISSPVVVISDSVKDASDIRMLLAPDASRLLIIEKPRDTESVSASFDAGADGIIRYPFEADDLCVRIDQATDAIGQVPEN